MTATNSPANSPDISGPNGTEPRAVASGPRRMNRDRHYDIMKVECQKVRNQSRVIIIGRRARPRSQTRQMGATQSSPYRQRFGSFRLKKCSSIGVSSSSAWTTCLAACRRLWNFQTARPFASSKQSPVVELQRAKRFRRWSPEVSSGPGAALARMQRPLFFC